MFSAALRRRAFHTFSRALQEDAPSRIPSITSTLINQTEGDLKPDSKVDATPVYIKGQGKKLPPKKPNLVILDAKNSNILQKKPKLLTKRQPGLFVLDALELGSSSKKLQQFETDVSEEQIIGSIEYIKPSDPVVSVNRYQQIKNDINDAYSLNQLKAYFAKFHPDVKYKSKTKKVLIKTLLNDCWKLEQSSNLNAASDLLIERTFELDNVKMFLLLIQNTIQQWLRSNVQVILIPEDSQIIVRASEQHVQYIELALENVFSNLTTKDLDLENVDKLAKQFNVQIPIDQIQKLAGVYFEPQESTELAQNPEMKDINHYKLSALGHKKFRLAKRLIVGALGLEHFTTTKLLYNWKDSLAKFYDFSLNDVLPWNCTSKEWVRLKEPRKVVSLEESPQRPDTSSELPYKEIYDGLYNNENSAEPIANEKKTVTAVTFGSLLFDKSTIESDKPSTIFQTHIPHIRDLLINIKSEKEDSYELDDDEEGDFEAEEDLEISRARVGTSLDSSSLDVHDRYVQLKFVASPFADHENFLNHPPLEFWIENSNGHILKETLQVFRVLSEKNTYVSLPNLNTDLKFLNSETESLIKPFDGSDNWLADQPGLLKFIESCEIRTAGDHVFRIPPSVYINVPGYEDPIKYNYVSMTLRKHLSFEFKDRLVQFSEVEGGGLFGSHNELFYLGDIEEMGAEEFKIFAKDALELAQKIKPNDNLVYRAKSLKSPFGTERN